MPDPNTLLTVHPDQTALPSDRRTSAWDIRNAPRNYLSLIAFQAGSAVFSFAAVGLITRYLGSEGYGGVVAVIAASQVAQVFVNWTSVAVVRFGVDEFVETERIARTFWLRSIVLVVNLALVGVLAPFWFTPLADWLRLTPESFWFVLAHFAVTVVWIHIQMSLQAAKLPRTQGFLMMVERLLIFGGLFGLVSAASLTPSGAVISYIAAPAAMIFVGIFRLRSYIFATFSVDRQFLRKIVAYSAPLAPMTLVGYLSGSYLDAIFVSKYLSTSDLGVYSVATQMNGIALQLPTLANTLLIPLFITLQKEEQSTRIQLFFKDLLPGGVLLGGVACMIVALVCHFAIPLVFGVEFVRSVPAVWVLLGAAATALPVFFGYSAVAQAKSATIILMIASISAAIGNVVFNFALIPRFGLIGCAWATVAACFIGSLVYSVLLKRRFDISLSWVFPAMLPAVAAAATFTLTGTAGWSILACVASTGLIAYLQRSSLREAAALFKNFRNTPQV